MGLQLNFIAYNIYEPEDINLPLLSLSFLSSETGTHCYYLNCLYNIFLTR